MPQVNCIVGNLSTKAINCWTHGQFKKHDDKLNTAGPEIIYSTSYFVVAAYITHNATRQFASTIGGIIIRLSGFLWCNKRIYTFCFSYASVLPKTCKHTSIVTKLVELPFNSQQQQYLGEPALSRAAGDPSEPSADLITL